MANYSIAAGQRAVHDKTLVANTVDVVTVTPSVRQIEILSDGIAAIYVTIDGSTPTVSGSNTIKVPSGSASSTVVDTPATLGEVVQLISSGTPKYSVTAF